MLVMNVLAVECPTVAQLLRMARGILRVLRAIPPRPSAVAAFALVREPSMGQVAVRVIVRVCGAVQAPHSNVRVTAPAVTIAAAITGLTLRVLSLMVPPVVPGLRIPVPPALAARIMARRPLVWLPGAFIVTVQALTILILPTLATA